MYIRCVYISRYLEGSIPINDQEDDLDHVEDEISNRNEEEPQNSSTSNRSSSSSGTRFSMKYKKLTAALCEVVDDFGLVSFLPLNIQDKEVTVT